MSLTATCLQLNFATEFLASEAIDTARTLDQHYKETGTTIGPLHGVPISVKVVTSEPQAMDLRLTHWRAGAYRYEEPHLSHRVRRLDQEYCAAGCSDRKAVEEGWRGYTTANQPTSISYGKYVIIIFCELSLTCLARRYEQQHNGQDTESCEP